MKTKAFSSCGPSGFRRFTGFLLILAASSILWSCGEKKDGEQNTESATAGRLYHFYPGTETIFKQAEPMVFPRETPPESILKEMGNFLAQTYFSQTPAGQKTHIDFSLVQLVHMESAGENYRIGIINMIDKNESAMQHFFQGSFGGQVTYHMIAGNFMQPQLERPLLDGLILQYNGKPFPELDHIAFKGIVTPLSVLQEVQSAILQSGKEE